MTRGMVSDRKAGLTRRCNVPWAGTKAVNGAVGWVVEVPPT
jgi:hypothetical protein